MMYGNISKWDSDSGLVKMIDDFKAQIAKPAIGTEEVVLKAYIEGGDPVERIITVDSGKCAGEYTVTVSQEDEDTLKAKAELNIAGSTGNQIV